MRDARLVPKTEASKPEACVQQNHPGTLKMTDSRPLTQTSMLRLKGATSLGCCRSTDFRYQLPQLCLDRCYKKLSMKPGKIFKTCLSVSQRAPSPYKNTKGLSLPGLSTRDLWDSPG